MSEHSTGDGTSTVGEYRQVFPGQDILIGPMIREIGNEAFRGGLVRARRIAIEFEDAGIMDEVAFEDRIRASLLDVRLTRQMQDTLVQSKQSAQVNPGQDPILESARKRRADSHGDIDRPSKAVRGNEESGSK